MACTYIAYNSRSGKQEILIEVRPELDEGAEPATQDRLKRRLYDRHLHAGLLVTPSKAYFIRDTYASLEFSPLSYRVGEISTADLFRLTDAGRVYPGDALCMQTRRWLEAVARSWSTAVPSEALPMMLPEMIGGLAQAEIEEWEDPLDAWSDAS